MRAAITYRTGRYSEADAISHIWQISDDSGAVIADLYVSIDRCEVANIEVRSDRRGEGLARALWQQAVADLGTVYHAPVAHRTPEGDAFARAVGGPTAEYPCTCYACATEEE